MISVLRILFIDGSQIQMCIRDSTHVVLTGRGKHPLDEYENEMNQRLPFSISRKKFKRHTQEELAKAYRELNEYPD